MQKRTGTMLFAGEKQLSHCKTGLRKERIQVERCKIRIRRMRAGRSLSEIAVRGRFHHWTEAEKSDTLEQNHSRRDHYADPTGGRIFIGWGTDDRRIVRVQLTAKGEQLYQENLAARRRFERELLQTVTDQERATFSMVVQKMQEQLQKNYGDLLPKKRKEWQQH